MSNQPILWDTYRPERGDAIEAWIKAVRDTHPQHDEVSVGYYVLDDLLDQYRLAADLGATFDSRRPVGHVSECCGTAGCDNETCPIGLPRDT